MTAPCAIIALTDIERADFLPEPLWRELLRLVPNHQFVPTPLADAHEWNRIWRESPAEILVAGWQTPPLPADLPVAAPGGLRYVCYLPGSVRKLVPRPLVERGLTVTNWGSSISRTVAECALLLTLMALRRASDWAIQMHRQSAWKNGSTMTQSLFERRVGLHGLGAIGQCLVPLLRPFTDKITAYSPRVPDSVFGELKIVRAGSLEELFSSSDIVIELAAATPQNEKIVTEALLRRIPEGGVFVNVGRGAVVDEEALLRVAREGRIQVALDVYQQEPLPADSPFRGAPNVTLLPHLGGPTRDRRRDAGALALKNLKAYLQGQPLEAVVSLDVYDRST